MFSNLECYVLLLTSHWSHITTRGSGSEILLGTQKEEKQKYMMITLKTIINAKNCMLSPSRGCCEGKV